MVLKVLSLLFFLVSSFTVAAQIHDSTYKNQIKFSFLRLVDYRSPGVEIIYEKLHSKKWATEVSGAYLGLYSKSYPKGYRLGLERKYFIKERRKFKNYLSGEGVFINTSLRDRTFFDSTPNITIIDTFKINKKTGTFNLKIGSQIISSRVVFEFSYGLGIRYRTIKHKERSIPYNPPFNRGLNGYGIEKLEGSSWLIVVPFNVKFGYVF
ncbi:MAG TPA: hypothetical protein VF622_00440 [Segetibacter sp.]|jgi:hypothetical protein